MCLPSVNFFHAEALLHGHAIGIQKYRKMVVEGKRFVPMTIYQCTLFWSCKGHRDRQIRSSVNADTPLTTRRIVPAARAMLLQSTEPGRCYWAAIDHHCAVSHLLLTGKQILYQLPGRIREFIAAMRAFGQSWRRFYPRRLLIQNLKAKIAYQHCSPLTQRPNRIPSQLLNSSIGIGLLT